MTATVSMIVGEAKNVLRVSNAALRFTPDLSAEQLQAMQKEMMDRMMAQRQAQGGQPGQGGGTQPGGPRPEGQGGQRQFNRQGGQGGGQGGQTRQIPRVFYQDKDGKLHMTFLRTGVSDTSYTEIVRSELKEGDAILVGTQSSTAQAANRNQNMGGMMFMGGPPPAPAGRR